MFGPGPPFGLCRVTGGGSSLTYSYTLWSAEGLPVRVVDGLDADALAVELATLLDSDADIRRALAVTAEASDVAIELTDGSQVEIGSRPV